MKLEDVRKKAALLTQNEEDEHALFWLLLELLNYSYNDYILKKDQIINDNLINEYFKLVNKYINENIPVQYLIGHTYFYGKKFIVNKHTLIPRFETEELISKTISYLKKYNPKEHYKILDLATGSGCIGITIKQLLNCDVTMSDINPNTLEVAKQNAIKHNVDVNIIQSDWFENINDKYDLIISNPPYIKSDDNLSLKVLKEPNKALFSGKLGIDSYTEILSNINQYLNNKGMIAFEHGYEQKQLLKNLINEKLTNVKIIQEKDLNKKDRYTFIFMMEENNEK